MWLQNRSKFTDGGSAILQSFTLPNLSFAGIQGYQRVFRLFLLGTFKGPHQLQVNIAYDFADGYAQSATVTPTNVVGTWGSDIAWGAGQGWQLADAWGGAGAAQLYEYRVDLGRQKCTSVRVQVSELQGAVAVPGAVGGPAPVPPAYNEGFAISSIAFEVGALPGANRLPASATYGAK